ncbi:hypothetical protein KJ966_07390 [bacterium]|nr:hypothetical protein [bacterium]
MKTTLDKSECQYWPFYCEENIWYLCQESAFKNLNKRVVFISNPDKQCLFLNQSTGNGGSVLWDYHVLLITVGFAWDFDTTLPFPCPLSHYLNLTFRETTPASLQPFFKIIDPDLYLQEFASDRSHMLDELGNYIHVIPPWPSVNGDKESNLHLFTDMKSTVFCEDILTLKYMLNWVKTFANQQKIDKEYAKV